MELLLLLLSALLLLLLAGTGGSPSPTECRQSGKGKIFFFQKPRRKTYLLDGGGVSVAVSLAAAADVEGFVHGRCGFALAAA